LERATFSKKIDDDFMIFSYDKIYDHKFPVTKCTISADRKTRKITVECTKMKQLERTYVTAKQFQHKQSQKGARFMHKIHKIAILIRQFTRAL